MAVAFDVTGANGSGASVDNIQAALTIANVANRFAILTISSRPGSSTASSVTLAGVSFSLISTVAYSTSLQAATYIQYNPAAGSQTATVLMAHSTSFIVMCSVFNGVDQASGYSLQYTASGSAAATTATISTSTTDLVFASLVVGSLMAAGSVSFTGSTERSTFNNGTYRMEHHTYAPAGTTQTIAFAGVAGNAFMLAGINIKAASTTPATSVVYTLPQLGTGQ